MSKRTVKSQANEETGSKSGVPWSRRGALHSMSSMACCAQKDTLRFSCGSITLTNVTGKPGVRLHACERGEGRSDEQDGQGQPCPSSLPRHLSKFHKFIRTAQMVELELDDG
jgi:hypothetical protein